MARTVPGIVEDGKVVPQTPLPNGLTVQILLPDLLDAEEAELHAEMAAWRAGNARAFEIVEHLADETSWDASAILIQIRWTRSWR